MPKSVRGLIKGYAEYYKRWVVGNTITKEDLDKTLDTVLQSIYSLLAEGVKEEKMIEVLDKTIWTTMGEFGYAGHSVRNSSIRDAAKAINAAWRKHLQERLK